MDLFSLSLIIAFVSVLFSLLSVKYWVKDREKAVLINVGNKDYLNYEDNRCDCGTIDLTNKYYQAEFGGSEKLFDGITVRAVIIDNLKINKFYDKIYAKIFLNDNMFAINGNASIIHGKFNMNERTIHYDAAKEKNCSNSKEDIKLYDYDLIHIKDGNKTVASFVFLLVKDIYDKKIYNNRIVVENQQPNTSEEAQNAE